MSHPKLIVVDAGGTLLQRRELTRRAWVSKRSPLSATEVKRFVHSQILTLRADEFTPEFIDKACAYLEIEPAQFPWHPDYPPERCVLRPEARAVVTRFAALAPTVVLTNVSAFESTMIEELNTLKPLVSAVYASFEMKLAKPDPDAFSYCARECGVEVRDIVMVGDDWINDIAGALALGARAAWLNTLGQPLPKLNESSGRRLVMGPSLADLADAIEQRWWGSCPAATWSSPLGR